MPTTCAITNCGRPVADAHVCTGCANRTAARLRDAADLWPELVVTIARLDRMGAPTPRAGRPAPASPIRPDGDPATDQVTGWPSGLPVNLFASEVGDAVRSTVSTWAKVIADEVGADLPNDMPELMRWLAGRMEWARHQQWAPEAIDELGEVPRLLAKAVDRPATRARFPVGPCPEQVDNGQWCPGEVVATVPASTERASVMRCGHCGSEWGTVQWLRAGKRILERLRSEKALEQARPEANCRPS